MISVNATHQTCPVLQRAAAVLNLRQVVSAWPTPPTISILVFALGLLIEREHTRSHHSTHVGRTAIDKLDDETMPGDVLRGKVFFHGRDIHMHISGKVYLAVFAPFRQVPGIVRRKKRGEGGGGSDTTPLHTL